MIKKTLGGFVLFLSLFIVSTPSVSAVNATAYQQLKQDYAQGLYDLQPYDGYPAKWDNTIMVSFNSVGLETAQYFTNYYAVDGQSELIENSRGFYPISQSVSLKGTPTETQISETIGDTQTLTNTTDEVQTFSTIETDFTHTDSTTVSTANGFDLGISSEATFEIPFAKEKVTVSAKYDYSKTDTQTTSETIEYKIPSQEISVKPGHTVQVSTIMTLGSATGDLNINATLIGNSPYCLFNGTLGPEVEEGIVDQITLPLGSMLNLFYASFPNFSRISTDKINYVGGSASYTSSHFSEATTQIIDLTENSVTHVPVTNLIVK